MLFRWEPIAANTFVSEVPQGWLLKSLDSKSTQSNEQDDKREVIAFSSSLLLIQDVMHTWSWDYFKWENIGKDTWRAKVLGGWVVKTVDQKIVLSPLGEQLSISSNMLFLPDPSFAWRPEKPQRREFDNDGNGQVISNDPGSYQSSETNYDPQPGNYGENYQAGHVRP